MSFSQRITPCLWFDDQGEEAANFYVGIFPESKITKVARYPDEGQEIHGKKPGSVMTVEFELSGQTFTALNGGPHFKFNEAISLQIACETQAEVDHYWNRLSEGGDPQAQQCGWLKDKFGLSWQVVPQALVKLLSSSDKGQRERVMAAMLKMKKMDVAELERAAVGG